MYYEDCDRIDTAFQGWSRKQQQALIASDMNQLHILAECQNGSHCKHSHAD
ncbi:hypothetical protein [Halomicronema hongdechloris]|uniref:hypothetical protein n=1 Tax=Halomicronema hongdechloris TaxID=1209493 RepID=UPI0016516EAA|nr:hypothetical protein [Halomicronema hongdechloris]